MDEHLANTMMENVITGPPNGPVLVYWLSSVVVVCRRL